MLWDPTLLASATKVKKNFELRLLSDWHSDYQIKSKWDHTCLDKHLQVSVMTGIIDTQVTPDSRSDIDLLSS